MPTCGEAPSSVSAPRRRFIALLTQRRPIHQTLMIVLVIALAPLAVLAAIQGFELLSRDARDADMVLGEWVVRTAEPENNPITRVQPLVDMLALHPAARLDGGRGCTALLAAVRESLPAHVTLVVADAANLIRCSSDAALIGKPLPWEVLTKGTFMRLGPAALPARVIDSRVAALIGLESLAARTASPQKARGAITLLADGSGNILAGNAPRGWESVALGGEAGAVLAQADANGREWTYVQAPLHSSERPEDSLHLIFARPSANAFGQDWWFFASSFALPLVALLLASIAIWVGANHSILRWISELRQITGLIGEGSYRIPAERFEEAPIEIRALAADAQRMARTIAERDRTLTDALERQKALTLELNHRVRNNLQLISSYLTLQTDARPVGEHGPIDAIRLRVNALALVHRLLYSDFEHAAVRADVLFTELAKLLADEFDAPPVRVDAPALPIGIDSAVPIALAVVEAGAWLQAEAGSGLFLSSLSLDISAGQAVLRFGISGPAEAGQLPERPRLMAAIARQLRGQLLVQPGGAAQVDMVLVFSASNLDELFRPNVGNGFGR